MTNMPWRSGAIVAVVSVLIAMPARAQSSVDGWLGLKSSDLQTIYVKDTGGREVAGKLLRLNSDSLVLLVDGAERRVDIDQVARIQKRDSLKNGTLIGLTVGFVMGTLAAGISDCPSGDPGGSCGAYRIVGAVLSAGVYAGLGAGIDALVRGRTTLYEGRTDYGRQAEAGPSFAPSLTLARVRW